MKEIRGLNPLGEQRNHGINLINTWLVFLQSFHKLLDTVTKLNTELFLPPPHRRHRDKSFPVPILFCLKT